jgi:Ion channel
LGRFEPEPVPMRSTIKAAHKRFRTFQDHAREPGLTALLVIQVSLIFVVMPLSSMGVAAAGRAGDVRAPGDRRAVVTSRSYIVSALVVVAVVLTPFGAFVRADHPSLFTELLSAGGRLLGLVALSWVIVGAVFAAGRVSVHRIQGAVILYLNFALFFFVLYRLLDTLTSHAFSGLPPPGTENGTGSALLYFSFTTLTTAGYGDITPVHPLARNLANLESVVGQLYPATLLARLVSLELEHRRQSKASRAE